MSDITSKLDKLTPEQRRLLALRLKAKKSEAAAAPAPEEGRGAEYPLSFQQQRLWLIDRLEPGTAAYNIPAAIRVHTPLDPRLVERALDEIVRRHETLRTRLEEREGGEAVQVVAPHRPFRLEVLDLSQLPEDEREAGLRRLIAEEAHLPFRLEEGPLFRARMVRLAPADHALLVNMHHVVSDGWSVNVFWGELGALMSAFAEGRPSPLPPLPVQYGEYARRQRERLSGRALEKLLGRWKERLAGAPLLLELPADRPRPPVQTYRGSLLTRELGRGLAPRVQALAQRQGVTPFMVLLAGYQLLLSRYTGQRDLLVGTAIAGRNTSDVEGLIGFFANTLALRGDLSGDPSFRELLARVRETTLEAYAHQEMPFERLVEELNPERSLAHAPVLQTLFVLQTPAPGQAAPEHAPGVETEAAAARVDLTLSLMLVEGRAFVTVEYSDDLFERPTIERLLAHYEALLDAALADPDAPAFALPMLAPGEREKVLGEWADGGAAGDRGSSVHALFARQQARAPEAVALSWDGGEMTFGELERRANRLARHLRRLGARPGSRVGVGLERGPEMVVAFLAALKAGGAYVPLDPTYPPDRLAYMAADSAVPVLVTESRFREAFAGSGAAVLCIDESRGEIEAEAEMEPGIDPGPEAPAYLIYTSGSTGRPKGVAVPHRAIVRLVRQDRYAELGPGEVFYQISAASFDVATFEIWAALLNGGRLVLPGAQPPTPREIGEHVRGHGVTTLWLTAGLFHLVVDEEIGALAGVRQLLAGGDVLSVAHVRRVLEAYPQVRLIDGYGPTENTTFTTCHTVRPEDLERPSIPVGRPIAGTLVYILDEGMRPCPVGVPGELYAGGDGLALGYHARPALTAEKWVPDPFSGRPGARLYRTGDRARWIESAEMRECESTLDPAEDERTDALTHSRTGVVEYLGRIDQQVKVRGFRIEPGEIEAALREHPHVGDAVVVARADGPGEKRLVAYVVPRDGTRPAAAALREALGRRLPAHMVPSAFMVLDTLPLNPSGKVDRAALPAPDAREEAEAYVAPRTPTEEVVAGIWAGVLREERVGAADDFFALGGHSLIATQVVSRVRQALGVDLPLRALFEASTLAAFAARVDEALRAGAGTGAPPIVPVEGNDLPLSFAQERLWFIDRLEPGNPVYNIPFPLRLKGALDVPALQRALSEVVRRHDSLRTRFPTVDGRPVQRVEPAGDSHLPSEDLSTLPDGGREAEAARRVREWALAPYDLERGPLFRAGLLRLGEGDHVLLVGMHHVVSDGWSIGVFWRELITLYGAFGRGEPSPLPDPHLQYADFAVWQRGWLQGEALQQQVDWWREHLAGAPALLELPTDRPRPPTQSHRGAQLPFTLPAELAEGARALARREGATLFMALLSAWNALLSRWSRQDDVVVGTPVAGRTRRETEGMIGFFVNTLPLRTSLAGDPSFRALLGRVRETTFGAYAHQDLPFERLVEELQPERSLSHAPVYQVMMVLQNTPEGPSEGFAGLEPAGLEGGGEFGVARVDLTLGLMEGPGGSLVGSLEYATDLFERATAERILRHFETLLRSVIQSPEAPVSSLAMLTPDERAELVAAGSATASFPVTQPLHALFAARAAGTPDAPALTFAGETLPYAELDRRANRLAHHLRALGAGPERLVGLCVERSLETVVGILAVLKAGAAYLPLDPAYPEERLAYMLEDSGASIVLTTSDLSGKLTGGTTLVRLDADAEAIARRPSDPPSVDVDPSALAYVIYTSGSTGRPKGVEVTHASVVRLFLATDRWFGFGADDVWTLFHSYAFDFSVWEIWGALLYGGRLVVVPWVVSRSPEELHALLERERVTVLNQTPSAFRQLIRVNEEAARDLALRVVIFGGEALDPASLRGWVERRGDESPRLVNMYGITETTVHVTYRPITADDVRAGSASPIGVPIPDLSVHVLDARGEPLPVGVVGEMHVGGAGVARGYLRRPELTAQRFVPDPFSSDPAARLYRSGDLARRLPDGSLEFQGRADDQVKVRGFRIELGEIESVLLEHPAVREAVVLARGAGADDRRLYAWVVPSAEVTSADLRAHLLERLPDYMVPAAFVPLDRLPLTRNGKVDRRALPEPEADAAAGADYVAPRTPTEEVLAGVWAGLLGRERVGATDGFFELGGHSLLATRVVSRLREDFGVEVPVRAVFEHPTLGALAAEIDRLLRAEGGVEAPPIRPAARDGDAPLSFAQERLWFVQQMEPASSVYHMPFAYSLSGALDVDALHRALEEVVRRHETLRTSFPLVDGDPVQRVSPPAPVEFPLHDLSDLSDEERGEVARRIAAAHAEEPFDLERGPLFRAALVRLEPGEHLLLVNLHHVVSDGWSTGVLWSEWSALYGAFARGEPSPLPELPVQYADFAVWQRGWLRGEVLERQLDYWRRTLAGAPPLLELPTDCPRPPVQAHRGEAVSTVLSPDAAERIAALGRREGATQFMVLLAALDVVLSRLSGQDDVVVGTPIAGRTRAEVEGLIGLFLNSLALRADLSGDPTFRELLHRVRETTLGAYAHQDLPFERILEELQPERSLSHTPVFQVMLNLANFGDGEVRLPGVEAVPVGAASEVGSKFDLTIYAGESPDGTYLHLVYDADLFEAERMRGMLAQLVSVLEQAAADPGVRVGEMSLVTGEQRPALPDPAAPLSAEWRESVPALFAAWAGRTPDAVAAEDPGERWTYAELDASSAAVAARLVADGVAPGDVVAILGHRSTALVRALLGTLRSGAAFLVLDPAYPPARLAEYVRIARPTGFLRLAAAGEVPAEVAAALAETVKSTVELRSGTDLSADEVNGVNESPDVEIGPDSLAYLSFTSGTTGKPKAVMGRHGSLTHFTPWLAETFGLSAADRFSLLSGLAHDPLHRDVFTPLQLGAAVVAPDPEEVGTPGYLAGWMRAAGITVAHLTPAMGQVLVDLPGGIDAASEVPSLRRAFFVGDVLTRTDVARLHRLAPNLQVVNYYGSTETQRAVGHFVVPRDLSLLAKETVPVGRGIPDVQLLVRTPSGALAGVGEVGEIWLRSPHVALGYLGDEELTAERFVANPWTGAPDDLLYRTGDLGRYRPDGVVEVAGRADRQVKVRGFRIEPGEVEAALRALPALRDAVVVPRGEGADRQLAAYVVASDGSAGAAGLRGALRGVLPEHMVPAAFVFLEAIPLTPNGKVDRAALPEPGRPGAGADAGLPRTPTEEVLAEIWGQVLGAERIGPASGFFDLGGHSLMATRVASRVREALGVELPLRAVFEHSTLAAMALEIDRLRAAERTSQAPPLVPVPRGDRAPASFAQERLWFVDALEPGSPVYHISSNHRLPGPVDPAAMRRALEALVRRHETLRTSLVEVDGLPAQHVAPPGPVELPFHDLTVLPWEERRPAFLRLAEADANRPFDLARGPLFRLALVRLTPEDHVLLLTLHHVVGDGWSVRVFLDELTALHAAFARGEPAALPELPIQYADYAVWQREWLTGARREAQLAYWRQALAGAPPLLRLPTDRPRPGVQTYAGASENRVLSPELTGAVLRFGRQEGATAFMVLLAALDVVLSRLSGEADVVVGTPVAGRTRAETERLIGPFLNTLALRVAVAPGDAFAAHLARVREATLGAYGHQDVPFEQVLEAVQPERTLSHTPVFQVMLNLLNYAAAEGTGDPAAPATSALGAGAQLASKFDFTLYAGETPEGLTLHCVYNPDLFDAARIAALLAQLEGVLRQAVEDPARPLAALSLATPESRAVLPDPETADAVVRTPSHLPAGIGELGEVWARGADGALHPTGAAARYRPDGSIERVEDAVPAAAAVPAPAPAVSIAPEIGRLPKTATERAVAAIWAEVLGVDHVEAEEDFFALGGHSLRATQVLSRIAARLGVKLPVKAFFAAPTVAALAAAVDAAAPAAAASVAPTVAPAPEPEYPPGVYPLSFAQLRLWVLMQLGGTQAYHMPSALRLGGPLDDWALERALDEIVRRHESLRTRIEPRGGEPVQVVQPPRPLRLRAEDVRPEPGETVDDALRRLAEEEAAREFAPEGPFLRVRLLRAGNDDHLLLWTTHHLVSDGWSLGVFQSEMAALYRAFVRGEPSPLPPLPLQYGPYALEQRRRLSGAALDALVGWWKERLAGAPALLELPTDRPRPAHPSGRGASLWLELPEETAARVGELARRRGATPFMVLLAAFQALLSRWSGQDDLVVGTPIANRTRTELEGLIGFFANTLALRGDLSGEPTFAELLGRVREATLGAYEHQDVPFERLVEELNPERSLSHSPVFQVMFVLQNAPAAEGAAEMEGVTVRGLAREREAAKYDLTLSLFEHAGALHGMVEYATDLFDAGTMERLAEQMSVLLDAALAAPDTPVADLPLLDAGGRAALLETSSGARAEYPDVPLHALFEAQAARTPGAVALVFGGERVTYAELEARANRLAHLLRARGIGPESPVAVFMERSVEMVIALYGVLKAGAAYVPVDPEYPEERVAYMLEDSAAALALTQDRLASRLPGGIEAVALDRPGVLDDFPADRPASPETGTDRLAYVIYTSGSTGRPKGAMNAHRGVVNRILWMQDAFGLTADDAVLQKTPFSFDVSVWEFFWPLAVGARLVIAPPGAHRDPAAITGLIEREGITTLHFVPSMLRAWIDGADAERCGSLKKVMSSGEALPPDLIARFFERLPSVELHNLYGPTEAAVDVTHWPCSPDDGGGTVPIGAPIASTRMYVLDPRGAPCPVGVPGELFIAGVQVGRGYWRRPGLTAERFLPDPFSGVPGARMYRTGDRARWTERTHALTHSRTAVLEYLGRTDFQVKVRGFRIELGEIEAALAALPGVRQAVVDARPGPGGDRLVAWVAGEGGAAPAAAELRSGLLRTLPEHMVPSVFVPVDGVPLTPSGKADRRALPDPGRAAEGRGYVAPDTPTEQLLAGLWADLLRVDRVGATDGFFALGGHSLLATQMVSRVRELWSVELPLREVFEAPGLRELAARIDAAAHRDDFAAAPRLVPGLAPENDAPLSFAQERLWFIDRLEPGSALYNMSPSVRLAGEVDVPALERALAEVVRRHEPLRTSFPEVDGVPVQRIAPPVDFHLPVEDLSSSGDEDRERDVVRLATEFARAPFDLQAGPLFRARLLKLADDDHVLLLAMHHAVSDGWSTGILFRELFALYEAYRAGETLALPPLPVRYADFAAWQREWLRGEALERQVAYWRERLAGAPAVLELPTDRPRPAVRSPRGASHLFGVPAEVAGALRTLARREGATLFMAVLAAFDALLARWSGQDDMVVGTAIAGRTRREVEDLVGLFINTLAIRADLSGDPAFRELLGRVRRTTLEAYAHQDLPFEKLVQEIQPARSLSHTPVFQAMLVLESREHDDPAASGGSATGLRLAPVAREGTPAQVDLTLVFMEMPDGSLAASLRYAAELFEPATVARMAGELGALLGAAVADPDLPLSALVPADGSAPAPRRTDRPAMPEPESGPAEYVPPRTDTERALARIWAGLLEVERVGVEDGFFDLGGHSLLATRMISRVREALGVEVPLAALFEAPRLGAFAARVEAEAHRGEPAAAPPLARVAPENDAPLSFAQERLWFIDRLEPGSAQYNMSPSVRLVGEIDVPALERALAEVVRRHEPLRTSFPEVDGLPVQRIAPAGDFPLPVEDLSSSGDEDRERDVVRLATEFALAPFDLWDGPLFRARLLKLAADDHVLLLAMHHAVSDGWSLGILFRELFALYEAFRAGQPSPLPPLAVRYADFAAWQREWLRGDALERQLGWWRERLAGAPALLELPTDRPRPAVRSPRGASHLFAVPAGVAEGLRALAAREGATPFMALLAAFGVLLSRWSGQDDVVVGTPIAGRTRRELEELVGLFVNTLALRTDLSGKPGFVELLGRVREATLGAFAHQDLPFEKLVEEIQPERSLSHTPVFQAMFVFQNTPDGVVDSPAGLALAPVEKEGVQAKVDLQLTMAEMPDGGFAASLGYAAELFEPATAGRMAAQLVRLLEAVISAPTRPVSSLPLLDEAERAALQETSSGARAEYPDVPLHALFEAQAARTPDAVALVFDGERITYAELEARANRLAHLLRARGIGPESPVAVFMERSVEMVVALYGVLKAGAAYVPVDPEYPEERVAYMLEDSAAALALTQDRLASRLPSGIESVALDRPGVLDDFPADRPASPENGTDRLAYVIYTSGSTGRPKGAMNAHRGVVNRILWMQDAFGLTGDDAVLQKTPFSFDVSVWEFFWPLAVGARLVIAPPGAHREPAALTELIEREGITTLHFVPSMLRAWIDGADAERCRSLRKVMSSGEALPPDLVASFFERLPSVELHNLYGPTEAAVDVTYFACSGDDDLATVPIGRPIANTRMYVLDPRGELCPVGVPGELFIAGVQVGRGYWRRPGLTAERFLPDPFSDSPGARMYRTGDRARWVERTHALTHSRTAVLEYLGRTDFQVKVRGFRIELGEVEAALKEHSSVRDAVVVERGGRLVAYLTAADGRAPDPAELGDALARRLPDYMVPSAFVALDELPLTGSGKVDRRALPEPAAGEAGDAYVVPRDATELELARLWEEVLGVERVGAADDFFRLGGHSLLAVRLLARVRERFGRELPLAELFRAPTPSGLAAALRREGAGADEAALLVTLRPGGDLPPFFCTPPAGGTITHYADLARLLGPDQPFHAFQAVGVAGEAAPLETVEEMAARYLAELRRVQPRGPYYLGGWSAGGITAFEMARRLRAEGEEVALLALFDTLPPDPDGEGEAPDRVELFVRFARSIVTGDEERLDALAAGLRALPPGERLAGLARWMAAEGVHFGEGELDRVGRVMAVYEATARATRAYRVDEPYGGRVALFCAEEGSPAITLTPDERAERWRKYASGPFSVWMVPGAHARMVLEPAARVLAAGLRDALAEAREACDAAVGD
jgi:amino acid adenylation domain-containing protein